MSPSLFGPWHSRQHLGVSIIVDNNRHKRRQTFGSVGKTQLQTSSNRYKSSRYCCSFMDLEWHRCCFVWYFSPARWIVFSLTATAVCLIISKYCYTSIFCRLCHQHTQVHNNLPEEENQTTRVDITRYRKTVSIALWLQLALLFCYLPRLLLMPFAFGKTELYLSTAEDITITLMYFN